MAGIGGGFTFQIIGRDAFGFGGGKAVNFSKKHVTAPRCSIAFKPRIKKAAITKQN